MNLDLHQKNALVCGSSQGIGRAAAMELAELGANVTLLARNARTLHEVQGELAASSGQTHEVLVADFAHPDLLAERLHEHIEVSAPFHILINNTGGPPAGPANSATPDEFSAAFSQHLLCNQILVRALVPGMKAEGYGRIINVISTSVKQPIPGLGVSNTIRGAVANWAKTLATELASSGITVNNVLPGATNTARLDSLIAGNAKRAGITVEEAAAAMRAPIPARRFAEANELAYAIGFLASPSAGYITGVNLPVDGGRTGCL